jgi:hypothetical protein
MSKKDSVALVWCDNGMVDGKFMQGVADVILKSGVQFASTLRSQGNQIARQRQTTIDYWYDKTDYEWLLWIDSDVVISPTKFKLLWDNKDAEKRPLITGVYFTTDTPEEPLMAPLPTVFNFVNNGDGGFGFNDAGEPGDFGGNGDIGQPGAMVLTWTSWDWACHPVLLAWVSCWPKARATSMHGGFPYRLLWSWFQPCCYSLLWAKPCAMHLIRVKMAHYRGRANERSRKASHPFTALRQSLDFIWVGTP